MKLRFRLTNSKDNVIYRRCTCGESAHDSKVGKPYGAPNSAWYFYFACRNCGKRIWYKPTIQNAYNAGVTR